MNTWKDACKGQESALFANEYFLKNSLLLCRYKEKSITLRYCLTLKNVEDMLGTMLQATILTSIDGQKWTTNKTNTRIKIETLLNGVYFSDSFTLFFR